MKIIAIDSSGMTASVALAEEGKLIAQYSVNNKKTHSQTLLPMLDEICSLTQLSLDSVDAIALANGPGSFTGLRIGTATAKGLGLALDKPLIPVPTLEGMAWNLWGTTDLICPMMDARRDQVYTGIYRFSGDELETVWEQKAAAVEEAAAELNRLKLPVILLGDGALAYSQKLTEKLKVPFRFAPAHQNAQSAASLAMCAFSYARRGQLQAAEDNRPDYLRVSQAERERAVKLASCVIRPMHSDDLDQVAVIEAATFSEPWSKAGFEGTLASKDSIYAVAEIQGRIVGYCGMLCSFEEANITNVAVDSAWRKEGIAGKMLSWLMEEGKKRGVRAFTLEVRVSNEAAIRLYEKLGFVYEGTRPGFYTKPTEDAGIYWKRDT